MCEENHDQPLYKWQGRKRWTFFSMFYSTVTPLHDANDYNDGCMHGTDLSFYSIVLSVSQDIYSERASERAERGARMMKVGEFRTFVCYSTLVQDIKGASYTAVARSARLCYSDERSFLFVR